MDREKRQREAEDERTPTVEHDLISGDIPSMSDEEAYRAAVIREAAGMMREAFAQLAIAANGRPLRLLLLVKIIAGCSLREAGSVCGISKQAVQKHLDAAIKAAPFLKDYRAHGNRNSRARMGRCRGYVEAIAGEDQDLAEQNANFDDAMRRETRCLGRKNQNGTVIYSPVPFVVDGNMDDDLAAQDAEFERLLKEAVR